MSDIYLTDQLRKLNETGPPVLSFTIDANVSLERYFDTPHGNPKYRRLERWVDCFFCGGRMDEVEQTLTVRRGNGSRSQPGTVEEVYKACGSCVTP